MAVKAQEKDYTYPVYGTTQGGVARRLGSKYFFVESPNHSNLKVDDEVPTDWELFPANALAEDQEK